GVHGRAARLHRGVPARSARRAPRTQLGAGVGGPAGGGRAGPPRGPRGGGGGGAGGRGAVSGGRVVVTDVDGCLLDAATYSWDAARPAIEALKQRGIPLVLC